MDTKSRIALDVMGGDDAPACNLDGALAAVQAGLDPARVLLVGDRVAIEAGLEERGGNPGFDLLHADEVIGMEEKPAVALRSKPRSSIAVATKVTSDVETLFASHVRRGNMGRWWEGVASEEQIFQH